MRKKECKLCTSCRNERDSADFVATGYTCFECENLALSLNVQIEFIEMKCETCSHWKHPSKFFYDETKGILWDECLECLTKKIKNYSEDKNPGEGIYLIKSETMSMLKIGYTTNIDRTFKNLKRVNSDTLTLLSVIEGNLKLEKRIHYKFKHLKLHDEWYSCNKDIINLFIK